MPDTVPSRALVSQWPDAWLLAGVRTPFIDYTQAFALVSPIDLGIKVAREALARAGVSPGDVGTVITSSVAQTSYDAFLLPRPERGAGASGAAGMRVGNRDHRAGR
jgi:acetyl-CoA C-acetyltransferase